jgi:hypothetical protein
VSNDVSLSYRNVSYAAKSFVALNMLASGVKLSSSFPEAQFKNYVFPLQNESERASERARECDEV